MQDGRGYDREQDNDKRVDEHGFDWRRADGLVADGAIGSFAGCVAGIGAIAASGLRAAARALRCSTSGRRRSVMGTTARGGTHNGSTASAGAAA